MSECAQRSRSLSPTARSRSLLERPRRKRCERRLARDWGPAGRGRRKAGEGDGDGAGEASEGVEAEREEEGAVGASYREAASELVVDLGITGRGKTDGAQRKWKGKEWSAVNYDGLTVDKQCRPKITHRAKAPGLSKHGDSLRTNNEARFQKV